eukprot:4100885-Pyramimonas_sp.AAC.1
MCIRDSLTTEARPTRSDVGISSYFGRGKGTTKSHFKEARQSQSVGTTTDSHGDRGGDQPALGGEEICSGAPCYHQAGEQQDRH